MAWRWTEVGLMGIAGKPVPVDSRTIRWEKKRLRHSRGGGNPAGASNPFPPWTPLPPGEATQPPTPSFPRRRESSAFKFISGFPLKACGNDVNGGLMLGKKGITLLCAHKTSRYCAHWVGPE